MKPIEKGCMAIIIKGECDPAFPSNIGKIVTVGNYIGTNNVGIDNTWEVDQPIVLTPSGREIYTMREDYMQRIDDTDISEEEEAHKIKEEVK